MITFYGSPHCPHCRDCKAQFDANGIEYEYIDITGSMKTLKQFLKLRDKLPVFEDIKAEGRVGIPCLVKEDGTIVFDWRSLLGDAAETVAAPVQGQACSLDGKNC